MSPFRFPEPLSQRCLSRDRRPPTAPVAGEGLFDTSSRAICASTIRTKGPLTPPLRRREKYAAAVVLAGAISAALAGTAWAGGLTGDANSWREPFTRLARIVHSLDKNDVGPRHRGVFGRKAASLPDYDYSDALKSANIVWNEETLDKWLTDPQAVAPGAKMFFHLDNPQDRADVIAYLKERAK